MSDYKPFYNDWLDCSGLINENGVNHKLNLDVEFFNQLRFDDQSLKKYRIDAAIRNSQVLGNNPALCLSGGIDSQAMVQCFQEAGLKFDVVILVFDNDLNTQDTAHAKLYCNKNNISYIEIKFDVVNFLIRENLLISEKYKGYSPHFNVHYKLCEILADMGYTGCCFGGNAAGYENNLYGSNLYGQPYHYLKLNNKLPIYFEGSFLSYSPELLWAISLQTKQFKSDIQETLVISSNLPLDIHEKLNAQRYDDKVEGYLKAGFNIIKQDKKYTGFELVKKHFEKITGDGWTFEKRFRYPIRDLYAKDINNYCIDIPKEVLNVILSIHSQNI